MNNNLKDVYNKIAKEYYQSRNKHRNDGYRILQEIQNYGKKEISILEFGCGGGRCISYLHDNLTGIKIHYTGVDISKELLKYAQKDNPKDTFICDDICNYIKQVKQESFDYIIGIASFQHIDSEKKRTYLIKNFYKILKYGGKLIMTNRSFSTRFIKKYKTEILKSIRKTMYTIGNHKRNDLLIPWQKEDEELLRFYHIFTKDELNKLYKENSFSIKTISYLDKKGNPIEDRKPSNNTIIIGEKSA